MGGKDKMQLVLGEKKKRKRRIKPIIQFSPLFSKWKWWNGQQSRGKKKTSEQPLGKDQLSEIDEWEIN